ncbi:MAG TPA: hypothetical protein VJX67_12180, partial [Blastocatellia bacterium]|nr:hypothetical protein [Blastocatellia bacterium]
AIPDHRGISAGIRTGLVEPSKLAPFSATPKRDATGEGRKAARHTTQFEYLGKVSAKKGL